MSATMRTIPAPPVSAETKPFWDAAAAGRHEQRAALAHEPDAQRAALEREAGLAL